MKKNTINFREIIIKAIISSSINMSLLFIILLLMAFVKDGQQWFIIIPSGIINGIIISNIIKNTEKALLTTAFTIIFSVVIYYCITTLIVLIKPLHNIIVYIYRDVEFYHFVGNTVGAIVFIVITLMVLVFALLINYTTKP
jgi:hypothetical protein